MKRFVFAVIVALLLATPSTAAQNATPTASPIETGPGPSADGLYASDRTLLSPGSDGVFRSGDPGQLSVVAHQASVDASSVLVVLRNATNGPINSASVSVRVVNGDAAALGTSSNLMPAIISPGGLGLVSVSLVGDAVTSADIDDASFTVTSSFSDSYPPFEPVLVNDVLIDGESGLVGITNTSEYFSIESVAIILACPSSEIPGELDQWRLFTLNESISNGQSSTIGQSLGTEWQACDQIIATAIGSQQQNGFGSPAT